MAVQRTASLPLAYVPGIHVFLSVGPKNVDGRDKPGHDENLTVYFGSQRFLRSRTTMSTRAIS